MDSRIKYIYCDCRPNWDDVVAYSYEETPLVHSQWKSLGFNVKRMFFNNGVRPTANSTFFTTDSYIALNGVKFSTFQELQKYVYLKDQILIKENVCIT